MRVLMVQPAVSPSKGGAQWNTARLGIGLSGRGHTVRLVGAYDSVPGLTDELAAARVEVAPFNVHRLGLRAVPKLARQISTFRPDIVHSCLRSADVLCAVAALPFRVPVVTTVGEKLPTAHDDLVGLGWKSWLHRWALRSRMRAIAATSRFAQEHVISYSGMDRARVSLIPNGLDTALFSPGPRTDPSELLGLPLQGRRVIGAIGRISPEKRPQMLLDLIHGLTAGGIECVGVFVGDGVSRNEIQSLVAERKLADRVYFAGPRSDMPAVYRCLDLVVPFCEIEGFGLTHVEALACGIPVVAAAGGGANDAIQDGINGYLVAPEDLGGFVERSAQILRDPALASRLGQAGPSFVRERFSLNACVEGYERFYESALRRGRAGKG